MNRVPSSLPSPKINETQSKDPVTTLITINEKVNITKEQYEVLKTICDTYEEPISEYMQEALVEAMKYDLTDGNFSYIMLEKLNQDDKKENNTSSASTSSITNKPDKLKKQ